MSFLSIGISRTIPPRDTLCPAGAGQYGAAEYLRSALGQLDEIDAMLREHVGERDCEYADVLAP